MAATVSSPWGKPGAWALDAEEHEDELKQEVLDSQKVNNNSVKDSADFPSLSAAITKQPKKKKNQPLSLAEFASYGSDSVSKPVSGGGYEPVGRTHEDLLNLPTGPRQRSAEELERSRIGGGFKSYGLSGRNNDEGNSSRWGREGGGSSRVSRDSNREVLPSRADEIDDWSKTKKSPSGSFGSERRERGSGSFFDSQSKADELSSWVSNKPEARRFGGGFERRGSFDSLSRGDRNTERYGYGNGGAGAGAGAGAVDGDSWGKKRDEGNVGSGRPKLVLQPRTVPLSTENGANVKPKGSNPFGDARPREQVLAEKGQDWKEIDEKLESVKLGGSKEGEKPERGSTPSKWSFGNGRDGSGNEPRTWRKPNVDDSNSRPESAAVSEEGHTSENGHDTENEHPEGN